MFYLKQKVSNYVWYYANNDIWLTIIFFQRQDAWLIMCFLFSHDTFFFVVKPN